MLIFDHILIHHDKSFQRSNLEVRAVFEIPHSQSQSHTLYDHIRMIFSSEIKSYKTECNLTNNCASNECNVPSTATSDLNKSVFVQGGEKNMRNSRNFQDG